MAGPPVPPPTTPGPPGDRPDEDVPLTPEERRERRQNRWLLIVTVIALLAVGGAGYAISEVESTKDENRDDDAAVSGLRADFEVFREQVTERLDTVEGRLDETGDASTQRKIEDDLAALQKQVNQLEDQSGGGDTGDLETQLDDLEQRVEDLEEESN